MLGRLSATTGAACSNPGFRRYAARIRNGGVWMTMARVERTPATPSPMPGMRERRARRWATEALSRRKRNILELIADGKSNNRAAQTVDIAPDSRMQSAGMTGQVGGPG